MKTVREPEIFEIEEFLALLDKEKAEEDLEKLFEKKKTERFWKMIGLDNVALGE